MVNKRRDKAVLRSGGGLGHIVNDADVFLKNLLRLEDDVAAVGGNIHLVPGESVDVVHIVEQRDNPCAAGESRAVQLNLPEFSAQVGFPLQDEYLVLCVHREIRGPAAKHLPRRCLKIRSPDAGSRIIFLARPDDINDGAAFCRPAHCPSDGESTQRASLSVARIEGLHLSYIVLIEQAAVAANINEAESRNEAGSKLHDRLRRPSGNRNAPILAAPAIIYREENEVGSVR